MIQSINVKNVLIAIYVYVSLYSYNIYVLVFGLNFFYESEQVQFYLGVIWLFKLKNLLLLLMLVAMKRKSIIGLGKSQTNLAWCLYKGA